MKCLQNGKNIDNLILQTHEKTSKRHLYWGGQSKNKSLKVKTWSTKPTLYSLDVMPKVVAKVKKRYFLVLIVSLKTFNLLFRFLFVRDSNVPILHIAFSSNSSSKNLVFEINKKSYPLSIGGNFSYFRAKWSFKTMYRNTEFIPHEDSLFQCGINSALLYANYGFK